MTIMVNRVRKVDKVHDSNHPSQVPLPLVKLLFFGSLEEVVQVKRRCMKFDGKNT